MTTDAPTATNALPATDATDRTDRTDALSATLAAYREVLGKPDVSPDDGFFQLGGDSVQAMEALAMIEEALATELSPALFFTYPAAGELAEAIIAESGALL